MGRMFRSTCSWLLMTLVAIGAAAQSSQTTETVPILSGGIAFVPTVEDGKTSLNTAVAPVLLVPFGENWLFETRTTFEGDFERVNGSFVGPVEKQVDYLELDYLANKYLTVTAGRFLTPFGIYNERLYPVWVRNLQSEPLILPMEESSINGLMFRGGFALNKDVVFNYATYFSALTTNQFLAADRQYGARVGAFFPKERVEVGFSVLHKLQDEHANSYGVHFTFQPRELPLDIRTEYAESPEGRGYWIEPALKLDSIHKLMRSLGKHNWSDDFSNSS